MTVVGQAIVEVRPNLSPFKKQVEQGISGTKLKPVKVDADTRGFLGKLGPLKSALLGLGAGLAAGKAVGFFKDTVTAASDLNESLSKTKVVFGSSSAEVEKFASNAASSMGVSRQAALEQASTFGNLFVALKLGKKPAADMSTSILKLGGDLASFNNVKPEEALLALRSGLVGETEPLRKFGVNLNDATIRQKAMALGLIASTKDALTPAAKAQAAYALIMEQTKTAQGDFTRTSSGLANQQRILSARFQDLQAKIGGALLPIVLKVVTVFGKFISILSGDKVEIAKFKATLLGLGIPIYDIADAVGALITKAREMLPTFAQAKAGISAILGFIVEFKTAILAAVAAAATVVSIVKVLQLVKAARIGLNAAFAISPIGLIVIGVAALAAAFVIAYQRIDGFRAVVDAVVAAVLPKIQELVTYLQANFVPFMTAAWATISSAAQAAWPVIVSAFNSILAAAQTFIAWFQENVTPVIQSVITQTGTIIRTLAPIFVAAFGVISSAVTRGIAIVKTAWSWFGGPMLTIVKGAFSAVLTSVKATLTILSNTIQLVLNVIHGRWGAAWNNIKTIVSTALRAAITIIGTLGGAILSAGTALMAKLLTGIKNKLTEAPTAVLTLLAKIPGLLVGLQGVLLSAGLALGKQIIQGLLNGMESLATSVVSKARSIANSVTDAIGGALHIKSPSRVMFQMGVDTVRGYLLGVDSLAPALRAKLSGAVKDAIASAKQNLSSQAGTLAGQLNALLDSKLSRSAAGGALSAAQSRKADLDFTQQKADLEATIAAADTSAEDRARAQADLDVLLAQRAFDLEQRKTDDAKAQNDRRLADLATALNRGLISQKDYAAQVQALLAAQGADYKSAGENLGLAFADSFLAQVKAMVAQSVAIARAGLPQLNELAGITSPTDAVSEELRAAKANLKQVQADARSKSSAGGTKVTKAEQAAIDRAKKQTDLLQRILDAMNDAETAGVTLVSDPNGLARLLGLQAVAATR